MSDGILSWLPDVLTSVPLTGIITLKYVTSASFQIPCLPPTIHNRTLDGIYYEQLKQSRRIEE
jgi:hypothetical protein